MYRQFRHSLTQTVWCAVDLGGSGLAGAAVRPAGEGTHTHLRQARKFDPGPKYLLDHCIMVHN